MKENKFILRICTFLCLIMLLSFFSFVNATGGVDPLNEVNKFRNSKANGNIVDTTKSLSGTFITIFQVVGVGVALIMLIVLAMKYMLSAPGDKATIKKHAVVYIVGAIILFSVSAILGILGNFAGNIQ